MKHLLERGQSLAFLAWAAHLPGLALGCRLIQRQKRICPPFAVPCKPIGNACAWHRRRIAETLWRKLKYEWLQAGDYAERSLLCYRVWQTLAAIGRDLTIAFKPFVQSVN